MLIVLYSHSAITSLHISVYVSHRSASYCYQPLVTVPHLYTANMSGKMPRVAKVKNKAPAPQQITAEQILREAKERIQTAPKAPRQQITDPQELEEFKYGVECSRLWLPPE